MLRKLTMLAFALALLWLSAGCGDSGPKGPRLRNPDDPRIKDIKPINVGGAGAPAPKTPTPVGSKAAPQ
jgi:hypothetical protein